MTATTCPHCGGDGEVYDGALGKTAYECTACEALWARDHGGHLLWATDSPTTDAETPRGHA